MSKRNIPLRYHPVVSASYIVLKRKGRILLLRRYNTGYMDGNYSLPAGHFNAGESADKVAVREAQEELGISLKVNGLSLKHIVSYPDISGEYERMSFFFEAKKWLGEPKNKEPEKCDELKWCKLTELPLKMAPEVSQALKYIAKGEFFSSFGLRQ